jgi:leucyl-tRNA synthetase
MEYNFREIEAQWQATWQSRNAYVVSHQSTKPKFYVLDMFPYPSGSGLHVGHPLGYIASDIFSRYKRLKGFNVLHPMGYDAFGLPAEQYALEHGVHPAQSTQQNINNFRQQLDKMGFCYDWSREVRTCEPSYYRWTQWIFLQLFDSWFNRQSQKAEPMAALVHLFATEGNAKHPIPNTRFSLPNPTGSNQPAMEDGRFTAAQWQAFGHSTRQFILMEYRLAYCGYGEVNWCEALGTVLANDEVVNGVSERGGHPVEKKKLRQWYLRITEYADRLLSGLDNIDFSEAMRDMQTNWIGKSYGADIRFALQSEQNTVRSLTVYTTRPDTIFGVDFMVVAPEMDWVPAITSARQQQPVQEYLHYVKSRSERERQAEKRITGCFTGAYAINPFNQHAIPIYLSEYVLAGYGTGAIMAVPCGDERDFKFAQHFGIPITNIIGHAFDGLAANPTKDAVLENSDFLTGVPMRDAGTLVLDKLEALGIGQRKVNYKMRDAAFSRQRYWGEPFPIVWHGGVAYPLSAHALPLELPSVEKYGPGPNGEGPLANETDWVLAPDFALPQGQTNDSVPLRETNTMPGYAGSSWYFLRYMDPHNTETFASRAATDYWNQVDLYIGGTEHAVGHLLYSRLWTKVLHDLGHLSFDEPFKKLLNQGMIQGSSRFVYRQRGTSQFISKGLLNELDEYQGHATDRIHVDVALVDGFNLDTEAFLTWKNGEFADADFVLENGQYRCGAEVEKMSKSKFNTVNPDDLVEKYGADTFRMYEMFLGPVEQSKPWDTKGIEGVHRFIKKLWRLVFDEEKGPVYTNEAPSADELKVLHRTIKKVGDDTERFSFNTAVSGFMIAVNELAELKCQKRAILEPLVVLLAPYAPHVCEAIWSAFGHNSLVIDAQFPAFDPRLVAETTKEYPISINGKLRTTMVLNLEATTAEVEALVLANPIVVKWLDGKAPKKVIFIKGKMVNLVL